MQAASIYSYENPRQFLLERVSACQKQDGVSLRQLSSKMGLSHTVLVLLLQGKRPLRVKHGTALAKGLGLSSQERLYLQALIQFDSANDVEEKQLCSLWLSELHPERAVKTRQLEQYELIANWIHMAILSIAELQDFDPSPEAIAKRLGTKVNTNDVRSALERLKSLGLVEFTDDGSFKPTQQRVTTPDDIANAGVRRYHREVMQLADKALDAVPLSRREFQAFSISIPHAKTSLAKEMIRKFRSKFAKAMGDEAGDEVYQFNLQFFQLTESPASNDAEDEGADSLNSYKGKAL